MEISHPQVNASLVAHAENSLSKFHSFDNHSFINPTDKAQKILPRICVICVASYSSDILHGIWLDMTQEMEIIYDKIINMLTCSPIPNATEWAIYSYDGFETIVLDKYEDIELIHHKAIFLATYGAWSSKLLDHYQYDCDSAEEALVHHYQGKFCSELEFAETLLEREGKIKIPDFIKLYVDYESFKRDIFRNDYFSIEGDGEVYIFSNSSSYS